MKNMFYVLIAIVLMMSIAACSDEDDAVEMETPTPFFNAILHDIKEPDSVAGGLLLQAGWELYQKIFSNHLTPKIHGQCFRTMVLLDKFISVGLSNSKQKHFESSILPSPKNSLPISKKNRLRENKPRKKMTLKNQKLKHSLSMSRAIQFLLH